MSGVIEPEGGVIDVGGEEEPLVAPVEEEKRVNKMHMSSSEEEESSDDDDESEAASDAEQEQEQEQEKPLVDSASAEGAGVFTITGLPSERQEEKGQGATDVDEDEGGVEVHASLEFGKEPGAVVDTTSVPLFHGVKVTVTSETTQEAASSSVADEEQLLSLDDEYEFLTGKDKEKEKQKEAAQAGKPKRKMLKASKNQVKRELKGPKGESKGAVDLSKVNTSSSSTGKIESKDRANAAAAETSFSSSSAGGDGAGMNTKQLEEFGLKATSIMDEFMEGDADDDVDAMIAAELADSGDDRPMDRAGFEDDEKAHHEQLRKEQEAIWEKVEKTRAEDKSMMAQLAKGEVVDSKDRVDAVITFKQAMASLRRNAELKLNKAQLVVDDFKTRSFFTRCFFMVCGPPKIDNRKSRQERDDVFGLARMKIDYKQRDHERIVQTLYKSLTKDSLRCPRFGSHWELVGFQGSDPATDLRATGMLGLLFMLSFVQQRAELAHKVYRLSRDENQEFPFMVVGFNLTSVVLDTLRHGSLFAQIKKQGSCIEVCVALFHALYWNMYLTWKANHHTIVNWNDVYKGLQARAAKDPLVLIDDFDKNAGVKISMDGEEGKMMEF